MADLNKLLVLSNLVEECKADHPGNDYLSQLSERIEEEIGKIYVNTLQNMDMSVISGMISTLGLPNMDDTIKTTMANVMSWELENY